MVSVSFSFSGQLALCSKASFQMERGQSTLTSLPCHSATCSTHTRKPARKMPRGTTALPSKSLSMQALRWSMYQRPSCVHHAILGCSEPRCCLVSLLSQMGFILVMSNTDINCIVAFGYDAAFAETDWPSIQKTCNVNYTTPIPADLTTNLPTVVPVTGTFATPAPTRSLSPANSSYCAFGMYTIATGDTCDKIATSQSVSYNQLIAINGLQYQCSNLPAAGAKICLPGKCTLHTLAVNETCLGISTTNKITWTQFLSWLVIFMNRKNGYA